MTCIVAYTNGKDSWMGGDAAAVNEHHAVDIYSKAKVFERFSDNRKTKWLFGFAGSFRVGQIVKYKVRLPTLLKSPRKDIEEIIVCSFVESLRQCLKKAGATKETESTDGMASESTILIGVNGQLIIVDQEFQVIPLKKQYAAIGIGGDYAMGALCSIGAYDETIDPVVRLTLALDASHAHNAGIQKPFTIITTEQGKKPLIIT